jgi:hypothetical protein
VGGRSLGGVCDRINYFGYHITINNRYVLNTGVLTLHYTVVHSHNIIHVHILWLQLIGIHEINSIVLL